MTRVSEIKAHELARESGQVQVGDTNGISVTAVELDGECRCGGEAIGTGGHDHRLRRAVQAMQLASPKAGVGRHGLELLEGVRVSRRGRRQHDHRERGLFRRGHPVLVRNELQHHRPPPVVQRAVHLAHQLRAGGDVVVVQEVGQEHDVVPFAEVHVERVSLQSRVAVGHVALHEDVLVVKRPSSRGPPMVK